MVRRRPWFWAVIALAIAGAGCSSGKAGGESTTTVVTTTQAEADPTTTTTRPEPDRSTTTTSEVPDGPAIITVSAQVDGRSLLVLSGDRVGWSHLDWAAPGRHKGSNLPTTINGVEWFPAWPDTGADDLLDCECESDFFDQLDPPVPDEPVGVEVEVVLGRGLVCVEELPTAENEWTLVLDFDDNVFAGPEIYEVIITLEAGGLDESDAGGTDCATLREG